MKTLTNAELKQKLTRAGYRISEYKAKDYEKLSSKSAIRYMREKHINADSFDPDSTILEWDSREQE